MNEFLARFRPRTRVIFGKMLRYIDEYLDGKKMTELTTAAFIDFCDGRNWAPNTRRLCLSALKLYLKHLGIDTHPLLKFKLNGRCKRPVRVISPEQVDALLSICDPAEKAGLRNQALIRVLWDSWIRANEVCSLLEEDLDLEHCELTVLQKGDRYHTTSYSPETREWLKRWLKVKRQFAPDCPTVFCNVNRGTPLTRDGLRAILRKLGQRAGFEVSPHDFRRGGATAFANAGFSDRLGMRHGGWACHKQYEQYTQQVSRDAFKAHVWGYSHD